MANTRPHHRKSENSSDTFPAQPSNPSEKIIDILNRLRDRIANLLIAPNAAEFKRRRTKVLSSVESGREIEKLLDEPVEFQGTAALLHEIFRTECVYAGSLDCEAIVVMQFVRDAILHARQLAWRIKSLRKDIAPFWKDLMMRENEKAAKEAFELLTQTVAKVKACAAGNLANVQTIPVRQGNGPLTNDCRSFRIGEDVFQLSKGQAAVVSRFWNARIEGVAELVEATVLAEAELDSERIRDLFKHKDKRKSAIDPTFNKLFKRGKKKGTKSLNLPD